MQFLDQRSEALVTGFADLTAAEKELFDFFSAYLKRIRCCSLCSSYYSLRYSTGKPSSYHKERDHVDYTNETFALRDKMSIPYRIYLVLQSQRLLPQAEEGECNICSSSNISNISNVEIIRHPETKQPITVAIHRSNLALNSANSA